MQRAIAIMQTIRGWQQRHAISANGCIVIAGKGMGSRLPLVEVQISSRKANPELMKQIATYASAVNGAAVIKNPKLVKLNFDIQHPSAVLTGYPKKTLSLKTQTAKMLKIHLLK